MHTLLSLKVVFELVWRLDFSSHVAELHESVHRSPCPFIKKRLPPDVLVFALCSLALSKCSQYFQIQVPKDYMFALLLCLSRHAYFSLT